MSIESFEDIESRMKIINAVVFQAWKRHDHDQFTDALLCSSHIFIEDLIHELDVLKNDFCCKGHWMYGGQCEPKNTIQKHDV